MVTKKSKNNENTYGILVNSAKNLDKSTKIAIVMFSSMQILLTFLDLLGVALLGLVGAISISGVQSGKFSPTIREILEFLMISDFTFQEQVALLASLAILVLFLRTVISIYISRRSLFFFAKKSAELSSRLTNKLLKKDLLFLKRRSSQETLFALSTGCTLLYVGLVANTVNLVSDIVLLTFLSVVGVVYQPQVALLLLLILLFSSATLHFFLNKRARDLGQANAIFGIEANAKILEAISLYREIYVHNRSENFSHEVEKLRMKSSISQAEIAFLPSISRYVVEISMLVGTLTVSAAQFILFDVTTAVSTLTLFLAAGSRLAPALLRVQQGSLGIRNALGGVGSTLKLISELNSTNSIENKSIPVVDLEMDFSIPKVELKNVSFKYPNNDEYTLQNIDLVIPAGITVALVGPSAAGKTTLADIILGVINPTSGTVTFSSVSPSKFIEKWPNSISYVPQSVYVANVSLRENVALGFSGSEISDERVISALESSQLSELLTSLPEGLASILEENGGSLSGGQRQRLGIARALYTQPSLIVLDEATSALDAETESQVGEAIENLSESSTVIIIAHRLSTVKNADLVCYLDSGTVVALGTFQEVRKIVPKFETQAKLMGL
jgi:ABC-type multidrug transport system fused ATPase/permease subunit